MKSRVLCWLCAVSLLAVMPLFLSCVAQGQSDSPQVTVECTGWHALCDFAADCAIGPNVPQGKTKCECWRVSERHIVVTEAIKDETFGPDSQVKERTQKTCTQQQPCGLDEAPVCQAIKSVPANEWVSTYSYRGWCAKWKPVACFGLWADCMTSACNVTKSPRDPNRPLSCYCALKHSGYVGTVGSCNVAATTVESTFRIELWDFENKEYRFDMPGNEYVNREACQPLTSDSQ